MHINLRGRLPASALGVGFLDAEVKVSTSDIQTQFFYFVHGMQMWYYGVIERIIMSIQSQMVLLKVEHRPRQNGPV